MNLEGASATAIREALAGVRDEIGLIILPTLVEDVIMGRISKSCNIIQGNSRFDSDRYRGFIIELPVLIKKLPMNPSNENCLIFERWLEIAKQNRGREITSNEIINMFNGKETPLSLEEVDEAFRIIEAKKATDNKMLPKIRTAA